MTPRVLGVTAFAAAVCLVPVNPSLQSAGVTVDVVGMAFTPRVVKVPLGGTVTWRFQEGPHTTTSDQGFWSSGTMSSGDSFPHTFESAGSYPYHCTVHPHMQGTVKVRVKATRSPSSGWKQAGTTWCAASSEAEPLAVVPAQPERQAVDQGAP